MGRGGGGGTSHLQLCCAVLVGGMRCWRPAETETHAHAYSSADRIHGRLIRRREPGRWWWHRGRGRLQRDRRLLMLAAPSSSPTTLGVSMTRDGPHRCAYRGRAEAHACSPALLRARGRRCGRWDEGAVAAAGAVFVERDKVVCWRGIWTNRPASIAGLRQRMLSAKVKGPSDVGHLRWGAS